MEDQNNDNKIVDTTQASAAKDKSIRYDRQLRLWGKLGQEAIENTNIGVLGSNSTAAECLKNLVLPGIGKYEIIDDAKVTERDLGNNFFVTKDSKGKSRAAEVCKNLNEMNPNVVGTAKEEDPIKLIESNLEYFKKFNVLLTCQIPTKSVRKLAKFAWENKIPIFNVRSYGLIGYLRISYPELRIYENHNPEFKDLRFNDPFPEYLEFAKNFDVDVSLDKEENKKLTAAERVSKHADIPWLILAPILIQRFKEANNNKDPSEEEFQKFVKDSRLDHPEIKGKKAVEENYDELSANSWLVTGYDDYYDIPENVQETLDSEKAKNINADSDKFWVLVAALKAFIAKEGSGKHLPLTGTLPDMHGSTDNYLALQTIFKEKSKKDFKAFEAHLNAVVEKVGKFNKFKEISDMEVERFVKNARFIEHINYRSIEQELSGWNEEQFNELLFSLDWDPNAKDVVWYVMLRAVDTFFDKHGRYPGDTDKTYENDIKAVQQIVKTIVEESKLDFNKIGKLDDYAHEITRYGAGEIHNIAAVMGGTVGQEVIKFVTGQWVALNNTWIYNGLNSSSIQFRA